MAPKRGGCQGSSGVSASVSHCRGVISISHRPALRRFHTHMLRCERDEMPESSDWSFEELEKALRST